MEIRIPAALAAVVAASALAGCGGSSPEADGADRAFAQQMVPHHRSAVAMADVGLRRGESAYVKTLSRSIVAGQSAEIDQMERADRRLAADGVPVGDLGVAHGMTGMRMDARSLETAEPFDAAFLRMMTPHHEGAITMARAELARGRDPELRRLATRIIADQRRQIGQMRGALRRTS